MVERKKKFIAIRSAMLPGGTAKVCSWGSGKGQTGKACGKSVFYLPHNKCWDHYALSTRINLNLKKKGAQERQRALLQRADARIPVESRYFVLNYDFLLLATGGHGYRFLPAKDDLSDALKSSAKALLTLVLSRYHECDAKVHNRRRASPEQPRFILSKTSSTHVAEKKDQPQLLTIANDDCFTTAQEAVLAHYESRGPPPPPPPFLWRPASALPLLQRPASSGLIFPVCPFACASGSARIGETAGSKNSGARHGWVHLRERPEYAKKGQNRISNDTEIKEILRLELPRPT